MSPSSFSDWSWFILQYVRISVSKQGNFSRELQDQQELLPFSWKLLYRFTSCFQHRSRTLEPASRLFLGKWIENIRRRCLFEPHAFTSVSNEADNICNAYAWADASISGMRLFRNKLKYKPETAASSVCVHTPHVDPESCNNEAPAPSSALA